jgi:hypothetical protein
VWSWPCWSRAEAAAIEEHYEERAAIAEYLGGLERGAAERAAYEATLERWGAP